MRLELATFCFCSGLSSGKPYAQPSATLCAVEASRKSGGGILHGGVEVVTRPIGDGDDGDGASSYAEDGDDTDFDDD